MDEWREYRLGDLFERVTRKNTNLESDNVLTISAQYGLINQEEFFNKSVAGKNLNNYYLLKKGEFAYNKSYSAGYPMGATKMLEKYEEGIVSTLYICFRSKSNLVNNEYFKYYFESKQYYDELSKIAEEGARNHGLLNVNANDFFNIKINVPEIEEQKKISTIINNTNNIISKKVEKIEQIQRQKKKIIEKIFNKEIKLTNENGKIYKEWENYYIKDIADVSNGKSNTQDAVKNGKYPFYNRSEQISSSDKYLFDEEAIITIGDGKIGKVFHYVNGKYDLHQRRYRIFNFDISRITAKYFYHYFSNFFYKRAISMSAKGTVDSVRMNFITEMKIPVPCIEEQNKIVKILDKFDEIIKDLTKECDEFKKLKQGLMQQLLTGKIRVKI